MNQRKLNYAFAMVSRGNFSYSLPFAFYHSLAISLNIYFSCSPLIPRFTSYFSLPRLFPHQKHIRVPPNSNLLPTEILITTYTWYSVDQEHSQCALLSGTSPLSPLQCVKHLRIMAYRQIILLVHYSKIK